MYLHLGRDVVVMAGDVVGVFDLDTSTWSKHTKSFVLTVSGGRKTCYLSQLNSSTLLKRWDSPLLEG